MFAEVRRSPEEKKLLLKSGMIVAATMISALTSTKNAANSPDLEMRHGKRNKRERGFCMKVHIGASKEGLMHSIVIGPANEADIIKLDDLLPRAGSEPYGDQAYWSENAAQTATASIMHYSSLGLVADRS
jgi:IS5 family transposase